MRFGFYTKIQPGLEREAETTFELCIEARNPSTII